MKNIAQIKAAINETLIKPDKPIIIFRHISLLTYNLFQDFFANKNKAATMMLATIMRNPIEVYFTVFNVSAEEIDAGIPLAKPAAFRYQARLRPVALRPNFSDGLPLRAIDV